MEIEKLTPHQLAGFKLEDTKISAVVTYSYTMALLADQAGVDLILVGDSVARVVSGLPNFLSVRLREMIYHTQAVARACKRACIMADLPQKVIARGIQASVSGSMALISDGGADCVKVEGGSGAILEIVSAIANSGIPVVGHFSSPSARIDKPGAYIMNTRDFDDDVKANQHEYLIGLGRSFQEAGCCALLLSKISAQTATDITSAARIPTIGIGSGVGCDGQILVLEDLLGLTQRKTPYYVKRYAQAEDVFREAIDRYVREVRGGYFPEQRHTLDSKQESQTE